MTYQGAERRKENLNMEGRVAVLESQVTELKEDKTGLDGDIKSLTTQINALNIQIPGLINGINNLTIRIDSHEANAGTRSKEVEKHKIQCGNISTNVRNLWVVVGFIFTIIGILIVLIFRIK